MYSPPHDSNERMVLSDGTQVPATTPQLQRYLSLRDILQILWKRLWVIILVALVLVGTAVGISFLQTPVYEASAKLVLGQKQSEGSIQPSLTTGVEGLQQLTHTMVVAVDSRPVAEEVISRRGLQTDEQDLLAMLTVEQFEDTQFLLLSYRDTQPERARDVVNEVSDVSSERIAEAITGANEITVNVWEYAVVPETPVSPDPVKNGLLALGLGLIVGTGLAFLLEYLDDTWRSPEEVEQVSGIPTFGVIPEFEVARFGRRKSA